MAQSSLITVTKRQDRLFRTVQQLIAALDTSSGHDHDGTDSKSITASVTYGTVGQMAAAGTSTANAAGTTAAVARIDHVHALGTHLHTGATVGGQIGCAAFAAGAFTADAAGRAPFASLIWQTAHLAAGILSADAPGRALFAAGVLNVTTFQSAVAAAILSADATGRAFIATNFFNAATVAAKFATDSFDATACAQVFPASAIPGTKIDVSTFTDNSISGAKINWSYGATASTIAPDDAASAGTAATVSRSDHVHANTCAAPSAGLAAADAEGAASTFARSNHVHKATVTDAVDFSFGASDDVLMRWSTGDASNHAFVIALGASLDMHITDLASVATDWNVTGHTNPTFTVHSATTPATEYISISHDATTATIQVVGGTLDLTAVGSVTVNEASADVDFRVETNSLAYAIYADGAKDAIVLGNNADSSSADLSVQVNVAARTATAATSTAQFKVTPAGATTTPGGASTHAVMATVWFVEPNLTKTGGDTITLAATVYIENAPTEGSVNHAIYVASGSSYLAGAVSTGAGIAIGADAVDLSIGASADCMLRWSTADDDNHALALGLGTSLAFHICQAADIATDWNIAAAVNPTLYIQGATTPATEYIAISTDETDSHLNAVGSNWKFEIGGTAELTLAANALNLVDSVCYGSAAADGDLVLTASSHGTLTTSYIITSQMIDATVSSLAVRVKAGAVGDAETGQTDLNGEVAIDSNNGRWYFRYGAAWHYCAITAGFQIPQNEHLCPVCGLPIVVGDVVKGVIESVMADGGLHGLYCHDGCISASSGVALPKKALHGKPSKGSDFPNASERKAQGLRKEGGELIKV